MVRAESGLGHANETKNDGTGEPSARFLSELIDANGADE